MSWMSMLGWPGASRPARHHFGLASSARRVRDESRVVDRRSPTGERVFRLLMRLLLQRRMAQLDRSQILVARRRGR